MKVTRKKRLSKRQTVAIETKLVNRVRKTAERARRDARMRRHLRAGSLPYTPPIISWLSREISKPARRIEQQDVEKLLSSSPSSN